MHYLLHSLETLRNMAFFSAFFVLLCLNCYQYLFSFLFGKWIRSKCIVIYEICDKVTKKEILISFFTVILNTLVTMLGWKAWQIGWLHPRVCFDWSVILDFIVLLFVMDFVMFLFHRIGHIPLIYNIMHKMHHQYKRPSTLILFVLNPIETLGFGVLWTIVVLLWQPSWLGIFTFLSMNIIWGTIGHCGAEPFPVWWNRNKFTKYIANASFHAEHHNNKLVNYGFYTTIWDRIFCVGKDGVN